MLTKNVVILPDERSASGKKPKRDRLSDQDKKDILLGLLTGLPFCLALALITALVVHSALALTLILGSWVPPILLVAVRHRICRPPVPGKHTALPEIERENPCESRTNANSGS